MNDKNETKASFSARPRPKVEAKKKQRLLNKSTVYRGVVVCLAIVLGLAAVRNIDLRQTAQTSAKSDIGRLKFVGSDASENAMGVSAQAYCEPLEGEVVQTFSGSDVKIAGAESSKVCSMLPGRVTATSLDSVTIANSNGTKTTYNGISPGVSVGQSILGAQVIGTLSGEILSVETLSGIGYIDSLDGEEMSSYSMTDEGT